MEAVWSFSYAGESRTIDMHIRSLRQKLGEAGRIIQDITEAREWEQLRRDFTANVTHELKTPLTSISGFAELMAAGMYQKKKRTSPISAS